MSKRLLALLIVLCFASAAFSPLYACGDKFLVNSRGIKQSLVYAAPHPGSVLLYRNADSKLAMSYLNEELQRDLTRAGHEVQVVQNAAELNEALEYGAFDVVIGDIADIGTLETGMQSLDVKPLLLPIMGKVSKGDIKKAEGQYGRVLKASHGSSTMILFVNDTVDKAKKSAKT